MKDEHKTKEQLINELEEMRQQAAELEATDIERKRAEEELHLFKTIVESSQEAIAISDPDGQLVYVNPAHEKLFGRSLEEARRLNYRDYYPPESVEILDREVVPALARGESWEGETEVFDADGRRFPLWERADSVRDAQGNVIFGFGFMHDITERKRAEEALRRSLEETAHGQRTLLALSQAAQAVQRTRTPDEVYRTVGDEVAELGYHAVIFILPDDGAHLRIPYTTFEPTVVHAVEKLTDLTAQNYCFPLMPGGFFQRIIAEGETTFTERTAEDMAETLPKPVRPLAGRVTSMLGLEQSIVARLTVGGETHGLLVVTGAGLTEADVPAVTVLANQTAIAIENARLFEQVRAGHERLRNLAGYLEAAREGERTYIAREIHDEFGQALTALKIDMVWLIKRLADKPRLLEKARAMSDLISSTFQTVRRIATDLRPGLLDDLGLVAAIEWQAQEFAERAGFDCELLLGAEEIVLDPDLSTAIFRIFQETLTNVARHAEATEVHVELEERPGELMLIVQDNGRGITESQASSSKSLGLIGMQERARSWGGDVTFQGVPGDGTTVIVRVPKVSAKEGKK